MIGQPSLFDVQEAERRKRSGMARASEGRSIWLQHAREVAVAIAMQQGHVNADDVRAAGVETPPNTSPNIWGMVFQEDRFRFLGYTHSKRPEAHSNLLRDWGLA